MFVVSRMRVLAAGCLDLSMLEDSKTTTTLNGVGECLWSIVTSVYRMFVERRKRSRDIGAESRRQDEGFSKRQEESQARVKGRDPAVLIPRTQEGRVSQTMGGKLGSNMAKITNTTKHHPPTRHQRNTPTNTRENEEEI
jgi:hypothetical protein